MSVKTITNNYWNPLPAWGKFLLIAVVIVALYFVLWKPIKAAIEKAKVNKRLKELEGSIIDTGDGTTLNLGAIATKIHDSFYNYMLGTQEDESTAISELQRVPQEHIQQLAVIYSHLFSQNLQTDFITYVSSSEWDAIKYLFD